MVAVEDDADVGFADEGDQFAEFLTGGEEGEAAHLADGGGPEVLQAEVDALFLQHLRGTAEAVGVEAHILVVGQRIVAGDDPGADAGDAKFAEVSGFAGQGGEFLVVLLLGLAEVDRQTVGPPADAVVLSLFGEVHPLGLAPVGDPPTGNAQGVVAGFNGGVQLLLGTEIQADGVPFEAHFEVAGSRSSGLGSGCGGSSGESRGEGQAGGQEVATLHDRRYQIKWVK